MNTIQGLLDWFYKTCSACDGTGVTICHCNASYQIVCPECMGKGVIDETITTHNTIEVPCDNPQCHDGKISCPVCLGSGKTHDEQVCGHCHGSGWVVCALCDGVGRIERVHQEQWIKHRVCPTCHGQQYIDCPYCHGTKNRICPVCRGKEKVINKGRLAFVGIILLMMISMPMISITIMGFALAGLGLYLACQYFKPLDESMSVIMVETEVKKEEEEIV